MRIMGIDYGDSRIGVAVSDDSCLLAFDLCVVDASAGRRHAATELLKLIQKYNIRIIVFGYPTYLNGTKGDRVVKTEKFARALKEAALEDGADLEILYEDERLTTKYADRLMLEAGKHQKQKGENDKLAAMIILQSYLDKMNNKLRKAHEESEEL